jgi:subtilisin-like proprotein convertase family protein
MRIRIALLVLTALLALPIGEIASPVEAKKRPRSITRTFANSTPITLPIAANSPVSASLYPSTIAVSGLKGTIRDVNLRLNDFTHTFPADVQLLLVGPNGQTAVVLADVGSSIDVDGVTLRLDDEAMEPLPDSLPLQSGAFRPTNLSGSGTVFNAPAPSTNGNAALSVFDSISPNGTWRLFVQDAAAGVDPGAFAGGWELEIRTKAKGKKKR